MRYLEWCQCGAAVPARWAGEKVGCGRDRRSCGKPVELTEAEILERQAELQISHELMWAALGINMSPIAGEPLERDCSGEGAR